MKVPIEISFRNLPHSEEIKTLINEKAAKLEEFCDHIISCRVAVERPQLHQESGNPYRVRLDITVPPRQEIVIKKEPSGGQMHLALEAVIRDAFATAERKLSSLVDRQEGRIKKHPHQTVNALVSKLFPEEGYGFLETVEGKEVYFHKNSVLSGQFDRLKIGTGVHYVERQGEKGPQASTVKITEQISEL